MISDGSCDTEDWSNDAEDSAVITRKHFQIETVALNHKSI